MSKYDLSILIPARNEEFLSRTVEDILKNRRGKTEIIVGLDGAWADPGIPDHPDIRIVYKSVSVGQRAMTNILCKMSESKYVAKADAHCAFKEGFDVELMKAMEGHDDWTVVPTMKNLHAFNWVCTHGHKRYQGPSGPCENCGEPTEKDVIWYPKPSPNSTSYTFDRTLHFQYFGDFKKRPEGQGDITPTMSLQGSFFMLTRDKYWELNICDEGHGSWGQQGVEVACKTWLSGGEVMCVQTTWYAHMFRTQGGDFGFPYELSGSAVDKARKYSRDLWLGNSWPLAKHDLNWLIEKFAPVPYWTEPKKGIIYYTDNQLDPKIMGNCQKQLKTIGLPVVSASLKPMDFGKNIVVDGERGHMTYFKQILTALENSDADIIYFCEHDVLYHPSHFDFTPSRTDKFYYNRNWWAVHPDGKAFTWEANRVFGLVADRKHAIRFYKNRIDEINRKGFDRSYEPGRRESRHWETWKSEFPNIDIRHDNNFTQSKKSIDDFRDKSTGQNFQESTTDKILGWDNLPSIL